MVTSSLVPPEAHRWPALAAPPAENSLRVLIVAGDPLARAGLAALLDDAPEVRIIGQASDRDDVKAALQAFLPDVVLYGIGWNSDRLDGLEAWCAHEVPVVTLLGGEPDPGQLGQIWAAGPRGLLGRDARAPEIIAALNAVAVGLGVFDPQHAPPAIGQQHVRTSAGPESQPVEALTPRELEVLQGMADGLSNKMIARSLGISEHTVKYHVNAILGKLNAQSRTEAVVRATRVGLLLL